MITKQITSDVKLSIFLTFDEVEKEYKNNRESNHIILDLEGNGYCPDLHCETCPLHDNELNCNSKEAMKKCLEDYFPDLKETNPEYLL